MIIRVVYIFLIALGTTSGLHGQSNLIKLVSIEHENVEVRIDFFNDFNTIELIEGDKIIYEFQLNQEYILFENLKASTIYNIILKDAVGVEKVRFPIVTKSNSSGEFRIYFNNDTDESYSDGPLSDGEDSNAIINAIIELIDNTQSTIDMCSYNTNSEPVIDALRRAHNRGVRIRFVTDIDQNNFGLENNIPFPILQGSLGQGIMHNKFIISDAESGDLAWVQTGSTNYTNFQIADDPNHIIMIQDKSLAQVYKVEFEEMWGSANDMPNASNARFGDQKTDNTPHVLDINGISMESYFSPSDNTADYIIDRIDDAEHEINVSMLIFTRWELRDALADAARRGVLVKVMIEKEEESEETIETITSAGAFVYLDKEETQLHHKYAIIDEGYNDSENITVTGSKNWTFFGDTFNDENTLIINDPDIANIFRQEFQARWNGIATSTKESDSSDGLKVYIENENLHIEFDKSISSTVISSMDGSYVSIDKQSKTIHDITHLHDGVYVVVINSEGRRYSAKFVIL